MLQLTPLPPELARSLVGLLVIALVGTFALDRAIEAVLSPTRATARWSAPLGLPDFKPMVRITIAMARWLLKAIPWVIWLWAVLSFNPLLWLGAWQWWKYAKQRQQKEQRELMERRQQRLVAQSNGGYRPDVAQP